MAAEQREILFKILSLVYKLVIFTEQFEIPKAVLRLFRQAIAKFPAKGDEVVI